jgi:hypothetical protein
MEKIICITRSMNIELYEMMLDLCDPNWEFIRLINSSSFDFIDYIFSNNFDAKWVLNLDEDCYLTDFNKIYNLISYLESNDYDYCGIQDGGSIPVRIHNPLVCNPFFNLFNVENIQKIERKYKSEKEYNLNELKVKYEKYIRFNHSQYQFDFFEPFYTQFLWLLENGFKPFFNNASAFEREKYLVIAPLGRVIPYYNSPTLILDEKEEELAIHTWHSRYYNYPNIKKAINNCYKYAKSKNAMLSNVSPVSKKQFKTIDLSRK